MNCDGPGVAQLGTFKAVVTDNDVIYVAMLEYYAGFADRDTFATIGTFISEHDIGAVISAVNGVLGADLHTLTALSTDLGFVYPRLRE